MEIKFTSMNLTKGRTGQLNRNRKGVAMRAEEAMTKEIWTGGEKEQNNRLTKQERWRGDAPVISQMPGALPPESL